MCCCAQALSNAAASAGKDGSAPNCEPARWHGAPEHSHAVSENSYAALPRIPGPPPASLKEPNAERHRKATGTCSTSLLTPRIENSLEKRRERVRHQCARNSADMVRGPGGEDFCKSPLPSIRMAGSSVPRRTTLSNAVPGRNRFLGFPSPAPCGCVNLFRHFRGGPLCAISIASNPLPSW